MVQYRLEECLYNKNVIMNRFVFTVLIVVSFLSVSCFKSASDSYTEAYMSGLMKNTDLENLYITAGDRAYCVGHQDGTFSDFGGHKPKEMGGLYANPIKVADAFSMRISDGGEQILLSEAERYTTYPYGNAFTYKLKCVDVERFQFVPQGKSGMIVSYRITNTSAQKRNLNLRFSVRFDLLPSWFSTPAGIKDGYTVIEADGMQLKAVNPDYNWAGVCKASIVETTYLDSPSELETYGNGKTGTISSMVSVMPGKSAEVRYYLSGSVHGMEQALAVAEDIAENADLYLLEKKALYENVINRSRLHIPDKAIQDAYTYAKINDEWLVMSLDNMRFLGAGAVEYPWLFGCDMSYSLQGILSTGDFELAKETLTALKEVSEKVNGNGRIIHEMSPFGCVYNRGNTQETAHFICVVYDVYKWTGDLDWLKSIYPYMKKGIDWLFGEMDEDGNGFPRGYGIMEVRGLNAELIDVAVYSQQALACMSEMGKVVGDTVDVEKWLADSEKIKEKINTLFWDSDREIYCDFFGKSEDAVKVALGAAKQYADNEDSYLKMAEEWKKLPSGTMRGFLTNCNWVVSVPVEMGIVEHERAVKMLDKVRKENCGDYGPYLSSTDKDRFMTISTGVQAVAESKYGRMDKAVEYLAMIASTLHRTLPGSMCEMMPDYGCPAQAWTIYGLAEVLVSGVMGIDPMAYEKTVHVNPVFPAEWNEASIGNVRVGDMHFSMEVIKIGDRYSCEITADKDDWIFSTCRSDVDIVVK